MIASSLVSFSSRTCRGARALLFSHSMRAKSINVVGLGLLSPLRILRRSTIGRQNWGSASACLLVQRAQAIYPHFSW